MFSTLGQAQIPIKPNIPTIDETLETVLSRHPDRNKVFDAIAYLVFRSRFAANRLLNRLYNKSSLQAMALDSLKSKGLSSTIPIKRLADFVRLWNELQRKSFDDFRSISNDLRLLVNVELTTAWIERGIERIKALVSRVFFDLDRQRLNQLQKIFETALELCKQVTFEEQERLCIQIDNRCRDLLGEIEDSPTRLSVEELYPIIEVIPNKVNTRLEELYESSIPQLTLRLPVESYIPDNTQQIEVQITVTNRMGCSPAESLELIVQEYEDTFTLNIPEIKLDSSLRGGDQQIFRVPLQIAKEAIVSKTFSLPVYAQYGTRSGEIEQTPVNNFSIRLYSEDEFEEIDNPYAAYAEGGVVGDPEMFYGREELIANVSKTIRESRTQSKCVVIFGQKRAGKSSVLYHLKKLREWGFVVKVGRDPATIYKFVYWCGVHAKRVGRVIICALRRLCRLRPFYALVKVFLALCLARECGRALSCEDIVVATGYSRRYVQKCLAILIENGLVVRLGGRKCRFAMYLPCLLGRGIVHVHKRTKRHGYRCRYRRFEADIIMHVFHVEDGCRMVAT